MESHEVLVARFLEFACWDHHVHGKDDHRMYDCAAQRILAQHPEIAHDSLYTAVVCGELQEVDRLVASQPQVAIEPGGSRGWTPLLYLCYTRFSNRQTIDNALAMARLLLDHGANPNDFYMAGDASYTALVGVAGEGEQDSPRQPYAAELFQLLLERGAAPFDIQVLYNTHFSGDMLWWLELVYAHTMKSGRVAAWADPAWSMFDMGGYGPGSYFILNNAIEKNDLELARWALERGAGPGPHASAHQKFKPKFSLYERAMLEGLTEMADLLVQHGATPTTPVVDDEWKFVSACFRLDRQQAEALIEKHPEFRQSPRAMFEAAKRDRVDVVEFLLDVGVPLEIQDSNNTRALHQAAANNARRVAAFLIERGAEVDPRETCWNATPIGWAGHGDRLEMIEFLSRFSRNIWTLSFRGYVERVREVLELEPEKAKLVDNDGITPLWWLPDDESRALEIVDLLLAHGADPAHKSKRGTTAAGWALMRGMLDVWRRLGGDAATAGESEIEKSSAPSADLKLYERLAQDLMFAYETGNAASMQRLGEHFGDSVTWERLRAAVRQRLVKIHESADSPLKGYFSLDHARLLVARQAGFQDWETLAKANPREEKPNGS
jgi:uncharacterized protein